MRLMHRTFRGTGLTTHGPVKPVEQVEGSEPLLPQFWFLTEAHAFVLPSRVVCSSRWHAQHVNIFAQKKAKTEVILRGCFTMRDFQLAIPSIMSQTTCFLLRVARSCALSTTLRP